MNGNRTECLLRDFQRLQVLCELNTGKFMAEPLFMGGVAVSQVPQGYRLTMRCRGVRRQFGEVVDIEEHRVSVYLPPEYPDHPPVLQWESPIFHPNIAPPNVCLVGKHWSSKTPLDVVCVWLWDMARYQQVNIDDKWNEHAVEWMKECGRKFPLDDRTLATPPLDTPPVTLEDSDEVIRIEIGS